jgi:hypothetical protein
LDNALIYLPGFNSGPQSEKSAQLRLHFPHLEVVSYNSWDPDLGYREIDAFIRARLDHSPLLIGSSLGGFWAYQFAKKYALKCVLLNPCMSPETTLRPYIGEVENMYSKEKGVLKLEHLLKYAHYRISGYAPCTVLHEKGDELIPYRESVENFTGKARLVLLEGGNHRFEQLPRAIEEIRRLQQDQVLSSAGGHKSSDGGG